MGDGLKISKDKRHRSSSSLAGGVLDGTRSDRKLDIRASIQEVDDQFAIAEARCDELQDKIDSIKVLKRKRKLKKRSMTRVADQVPVSENIPFISVRTQPKKKVSQQAARLRRLEIAPNPTRGYLDPATVEQHRMISQVRGYNQNRYGGEASASPKVRARRARADGDAMTTCDSICQGVQITSSGPMEVACGDDDVMADFSDNDVFDQREVSTGHKKGQWEEKRSRMKSSPIATKAQRRRHVPKEVSLKEAAAPKKPVRLEATEDSNGRWRSASPHLRRQHTTSRHLNAGAGQTAGANEDRPVVELFSKTSGAGRSSPPPLGRNQPSFDKKNVKKVKDIPISEDQKTGPLHTSIPTETKKEGNRQPRRVKYRSRRYELPTVASQMKQAGMRYYYESGNATNIPFIASKSCAPSHNIGINIQQVLNGLKIQQPLSGIPLTIAHHMGLGHVPHYGTRSAVIHPSLDNREINVIKLGRKLLRLPSYRYMSYSRLLSLYREGDGMVPRFLRAISRPHYFYTSMYNLATNREDQDGATSKGRGDSQEAKQSLAEYASLYREYEHVNQCIQEGAYEPELERRKEELSKELAAREEHIRRVVQEYQTNEVERSTLRASASTAEEAYRHSSFKLNIGDHH